ncbi:hypothetical protein [uncultured Marinobacter sp.]|uniref:hypothetical protein n=1 Tax=uncultured Marinobacter sp. TaxID=187379 RepID=UPI0030DD285B
MTETLSALTIDSEAQTAYALFWGLYGLAFVVFYYTMTRLIRWLPVYGFRTLVKSLLLVLLVTPVESATLAGWWVPAWLYGGYESVLGDSAEAARAFFNMGLASIVMALVWMLDLVRYRFTRR